MFDIFYTGAKPNLFAHEVAVDSIEDARQHSRTEYCWYLCGNFDCIDFSFDVIPVPWESDHVYVWPSQWQKNGGIYLTPKHNPGPLHYCTDQSVVRTPDMQHWHTPNPVSDFDYSWHPDPEENFIHIFGTQWQSSGGPEYATPGAVEYKYQTVQKAHALPTKEHWYVPTRVDDKTFDFSWHPARGETYIHVFGTQWQPDGGPEYTTPGAVERKYQNVQKCVAQPSLDNWFVPDYIDLDQFDFSWHPRRDDKFTHLFGTQWHNTGGPEYRTDAATEVKHENCQRATSVPQPDRWEIPANVELDNFDLSWHPARGETYIHVFGTKWAREGGPKYITDSASEVKYQSGQQVKGKITTDIFVIDRYNVNAAQSYNSVLLHDKNAKKIRGVGTWRDIIRKACENSEGDFVWVVSSDYDYNNFDFSWFPENWQSNMIHVFGSVHQKWANVFRVPRWEFLRLAQWFDDIKDFPELNFVEDQKVTLFDDNVEIWHVDFGNGQGFAPDLDHKPTRFFSTWLETLGRICERTDSEYVWVTSSICDYTTFDFGWEPEPWQADMLHVFASNDQREGDTFLVPVQRFKAQQQRLELLGWFDTVNYVEDITVPAYTWPVAADLNSINSVYAWLLRNHTQTIDYTPSFWKKPDLHVFNTSGSVSLCPRDCKTHFKKQLYDYPYILRHNRKDIAEKPLDVVYVSNGEKNADLNWDRLQKLCPRAKRIDGVNGRAQAYKACAEASDTEWFLNVFAKCWVHDDFDFDWQPDYLQNNKHWIFNAHNPVTQLTYGHMGMIAYHKQLVLDCETWGLDFTLSMPHGSVPIIGSTADYATTPYETWRTAFREVVKLTQQSDVESQFRQQQWLSVGNGDMGKWSMCGAKDAVDFVATGQDLQLSFEWDWLKEHFESLYNH